MCVGDCPSAGGSSPTLHAWAFFSAAGGIQQRASLLAVLGDQKERSLKPRFYPGKRYSLGPDASSALLAPTAGIEPCLEVGSLASTMH